MMSRIEQLRNVFCALFICFISAQNSGSRQKRFDSDLLFDMFNALEDQPDIRKPPKVADTTQDTPVGGTT